MAPEIFESESCCPTLIELITLWKIFVIQRILVWGLGLKIRSFFVSSLKKPA